MVGRSLRRDAANHTPEACGPLFNGVVVVWGFTRLLTQPSDLTCHDFSADNSSAARECGGSEL